MQQNTIFLLLIIFQLPLFAQQKPENLHMEDKGKTVLIFNSLAQSENGKYTRANYIHPLYGLGGEELTLDFPKDHKHHRGIFWTWHQTWIGQQRIGDAWLCRNFVWDVKKAHLVEKTKDFALLEIETLWKSPLYQKANKAFAHEKVRIKVHTKKNTSRKRVIDFEIQITALVDSLRIGGSEDVKGYGGFSFRMPLPDDIRFFAAYGETKAQKTPVPASPFMNFAASFSQSTQSISIFTHPTTAGFPQQWILRSKGSMQNPVFPGTEPISVPQHKPIVLRYRILLSAQVPSLRELKKAQKKYAKETSLF